MAGDDTQPLTARVAQRLRDAGLACEIVNLVPTPTAVLRRDRIVVLLALALMTVLAWSYLLWLSADIKMDIKMHGMDMGDFRTVPFGTGLMMPEQMPWRAMEFAFVFAMWTVMMVGMMTPSTAPMFLMYARTGRQTEAQSRPVAATIWFGAGYFLVWAAFALLATLVQWAFERTELLDFTMASTSTVVGGILFVAAGSYQWTRLKDVCLTQCRTPFAFLMRQGGFRRDATGSLMLGVRHGAYCVGCCWAHGAVAGGRRDEHTLDCSPRVTHSSGEGRSLRAPDRSPCRYGPHRERCVVVLNGNVLTAAHDALCPIASTRSLQPNYTRKEWGEGKGHRY
jgi:predicted metal-binding membrane protein